MNYKNKASKACDFAPKVRKEIMIRDMSKCAYCHSRNNLTIAHAFIPSNKGGLGVKENGVILCMKCHHKLDNGLNKESEPIKEYVHAYMRRLYDINTNELVYKKYAEFEFGN